MRSIAERNELVESHQNIVFAIAARMKRRYPRAEYDDLVQDGMLGLLDAAERFVAGKFKFSTYAYHRIAGAIHDGQRKLNGKRVVRHTVVWVESLDAVMERMPENDNYNVGEWSRAITAPDDTEAEVLSKIAFEQIVTEVDKLPERERDVIRYADIEGKSGQFAHFEPLWRVTEPRVAQIHRKGLRTLRTKVAA